MYDVVLRRRWFGEETIQKLAEFDHSPSEAELLEVARRHSLGGGASLYVRPKGKGSGREYRVRDLEAATSPPARTAQTPPL